MISTRNKEYGPTNCFPTNFTKPYTGGVSDETEGSIKSKKSSKVHYTPGGFHKYVEMMKSRPKAAGKRRKPSRAHRKLKNRLKWGENSWQFFEPWKSFRFKEQGYKGSLTYGFR